MLNRLDAEKMNYKVELKVHDSSIGEIWRNYIIEIEHLEGIIMLFRGEFWRLGENRSRRYPRKYDLRSGFKSRLRNTDTPIIISFLIKVEWLLSNQTQFDNWMIYQIVLKIHVDIYIMPVWYLQKVLGMTIMI